MMRPDIKIVIAWSGIYQHQVAVMLKNKLTAYIKQGYPISVSLISEDRLPGGTRGYATRQDGKTEAVRIAEKMKKYFSDFDYAFFLFDTNGEAHTSKGVITPLLSVNLLYEYGLASSSFINRSDEKRIFCFSRHEINTDSLQYIEGIELKRYDEFTPKEFRKNREKQTDYIIKYSIHDQILKNLFYGLPDDLPLLKKNGKEYTIDGEWTIGDPMSLSEDNTYWADLKELKPGGINISLDKQNEALGELFKKEYKRFDDSTENHPEYILGRRLLYIIDRAVFIMYLRQNDYWNKEVDKLYDECAVTLKKKNSMITEVDVKNNYYIKSINALKGVFKYQECSSKGYLSNESNLNDIEELLNPISVIGDSKGNRMIYCMAVDYLALVYHKRAATNLGKIIGQNDFCLDKSKHYDLLQEKLKECKSNTQVQQLVQKTINLFFKAASLFKKVVDCQQKLQDPIYNGVCSKKYIWKSYALYNQARCEFAIHLILELYKHITNNTLVIDNQISNLGEKWDADLRGAVESRKNDYIDFLKQKYFPYFIIFNMKAEYYHALYEYELSCLIEGQFNDTFTGFDFKDDDGFKKWKNDNLTITDVLKVDGKVKRIGKLKEDYARKEIQNLINKLSVPDQQIKGELIKSLTNLGPDIVSAILSSDDTQVTNTRKKLEDKIQEKVPSLTLERVEAEISIFFARLRLVFKNKKS